MGTLKSQCQDEDASEARRRTPRRLRDSRTRRPAVPGETDATRYADRGQPEPADAPQAISSGPVEATDELVGELVGREVDDADEKTVRSEFLHGRPADSVRVKDDAVQAVASQRVAYRRHRARGVTEHRDRYAAPALVVGQAHGMAMFQHSGHGRGDVVEDGHADWVQAENIYHGVDDHDVTRPHEGPEAPASR